MCKREEETLEHILNECPLTMDDTEKRAILKDDGSGISYLQKIIRRTREALSKILKVDVIM